VITLDLNIEFASSSNLIASICFGESYNLNGVSYNSEGTFVQTIPNSSGCDSTITLELQIIETPQRLINASICQGNSYNFYGTDYSAAGTYQTTVSSAASCDSLITLNLSILPSAVGEINASICAGDSYDFGGISYNTSGTYTQTLSSAAGCDSVVSLNLIVLNGSTSITNATICEGSSYTFNGNTFNTAGTYNALLSGSNGCDSTATLVLSLTQNIETSLNASICSGASYLLPDGTSVSSTGTYTSVLSSAGGCDSTITVNLTVQTQITAAQSISICEGGSVKLPDGLQVSNAGNYVSIIPSAGGCDSLITTTVLVYPQIVTELSYTICENDSVLLPNGSYTQSAGNYSFQLVSIHSCDSIVNVTVNVDQLPEMQIPADTSVCPGTELELSASGAMSYQWNYANGTPIGNGPNQEIIVSSSNDIIITGLSGNCVVYDTISIGLLAVPVISFSPESPIICAGDSLEISVSGAQSYSWSGSGWISCDTCANVVISADSTSIYNVEASSEFCSISETIVLTVVPLPEATITGDTAVCLGESITLTASGGTSYFWSTGDTSAVLNITPEMSLDLFVSVASGACFDTAAVNVIVNPLPYILVNEDTTINVGGSVQLEAQTLFGAIWDPTQFLSCYDCNDPIASPIVPTTYCATVVNGFGCVASDCITINIDTLCNEIFLPNVFNPAAGGHTANDCFRIFGADCITQMSLTIYNRWGEKVYESSDKNACWDGTFRGQDQNTGVFIYYLNARTVYGETINRQGNVTLLR